jgi:hypothetical protein
MANALSMFLQKPQQQNAFGPMFSPWPTGNRPALDDYGLPPAGQLLGLQQTNRGKLPRVPRGAARPFGPEESVTNPDGSTSSEVSLTVTDPRLNGGSATIVPSVWMVNGKPMRVSQDQAVDFAIRSGLRFRPHQSIEAADQWVTERHKGLDAGQQVAPLWEQR